MRRGWWVIFELLLFAASASAKVWLLPDYQQQQVFSHRVNGGSQTPPARPETTADCRQYGMIPAEEVSAGMSCSSSTQILQTICYSGCSCSAAYSQTVSSCRSEGKIPAGSACMGEYFTDCICDTSLYPHTSSSCAHTLSGASCSDNSGKHYAECLDPCAGLTDNETDLGCEKHYDQCPTLCELGKTCVPNDCSEYDLDYCPKNTVCDKCTIGCGNSTTSYKFNYCYYGFELYNDVCTCIYGQGSDCFYSSYTYPLSKYDYDDFKKEFYVNKGFSKLQSQYGLKCIDAGYDFGEICTINCPAGYGLLHPPYEQDFSECISCTVNNYTEYQKAVVSCETVILSSDYKGQTVDSTPHELGFCTLNSDATNTVLGSHCSYNGKPIVVTADTDLNNLETVFLQLAPGDILSDITFNNTPIRIETTDDSGSVSTSPYAEEIIEIKNLDITIPRFEEFYYSFFYMDGNTLIENVYLSTATQETNLFYTMGNGPITIRDSSFIQTAVSDTNNFCCDELKPFIEGNVSFSGWAKSLCRYTLADNAALHISATEHNGAIELGNNASFNFLGNEFTANWIILGGSSRLNLSTDNASTSSISADENAVIMIPSGIFRANQHISETFRPGETLKTIAEQYFTRIGDYDETVFEN